MLLSSLSLAAAPMVSLPAVHPSKTMRSATEARTCAQKHLEPAVAIACAGQRCKPTSRRVGAHVEEMLQRWCRAGYDDKQIAKAVETQAEALATPPPPGPGLPSTELRDVATGKVWERPNQPVLITACATWVNTLIPVEVPKLRKLAGALPDVAVVCVAEPSDRAKLRPALAGSKVVHLEDPARNVWTGRAGIGTFPAHLFVTADGYVARDVVGPLDEDEARQWLEAELGE